MSKTYIPEGYHSELSLYETQNAIGVIHHAFEEHLGQTLNLKRVSAPLFVDPHTGLNDNLSGVERPVSFEIPATGTTAEVVHSLAKWKRMALYRYDFRPGKGLYTNMNAIRRDETLDNLHSIYVDQWDWERVITPEKRNVEELKWYKETILPFEKTNVLFVTGAMPPSSADAVKSIEQQLGKGEDREVKVFYLQSGLNYEAMNLGDKLMMKVFCKMMKSRKAHSEEEKALFEQMQKYFDVCEKANLEPMLNYIQGL